MRSTSSIAALPVVAPRARVSAAPLAGTCASSEASLPGRSAAALASVRAGSPRDARRESAPHGPVGERVNRTRGEIRDGMRYVRARAAGVCRMGKLQITNVTACDVGMPEAA